MGVAHHNFLFFVLCNLHFLLSEFEDLGPLLDVGVPFFSNSLTIGLDLCVFPSHYTQDMLDII